MPRRLKRRAPWPCQAAEQEAKIAASLEEAYTKARTGLVCREIPRGRPIDLQLNTIIVALALAQACPLPAQQAQEARSEAA